MTKQADQAVRFRMLYRIALQAFVLLCLVAAGMQSLTTGKRLETPHLAVRYEAPRESTFWQT